MAENRRWFESEARLGISTNEPKGTKLRRTQVLISLFVQKNEFGGARASRPPFSASGRKIPHGREQSAGDQNKLLGGRLRVGRLRRPGRSRSQSGSEDRARDRGRSKSEMRPELSR